MMTKKTTEKVLSEILPKYTEKTKLHVRTCGENDCVNTFFLTSIKNVVWIILTMLERFKKYSSAYKAPA